jgi:formyltetrahydrofolate-dependent phosphoribosylglycinamide formyltransferase
MPIRPLPIAVLISGGGTTLRNLLLRIAGGGLDVAVKLVISSTPQAAGLQFAAAAGIPARIMRTSQCADTAAYSDALFQACREAQVELVVMGGFLKHILIPNDFVNRVTNIHPGLIPSFCGKGYYGHHVHQAVLDYGVKVSGCTIHFVDNEYDHGPIILQQVVPVLEDDSPDTLAARVFTAECEAYPQALQWIAEGRVRVEGRRVRVLEAGRSV